MEGYKTLLPIRDFVLDCDELNKDSDGQMSCRDIQDKFHQILKINRKDPPTLTNPPNFSCEDPEICKCLEITNEQNSFGFFDSSYNQSVSLENLSDKAQHQSLQQEYYQQRNESRTQQNPAKENVQTSRPNDVEYTPSSQTNTLFDKFKRYPTHQLEMALEFLQQFNDLGETVEIDRPLSMKKEGRSILISIREPNHEEINVMDRNSTNLEKRTVLMEYNDNEMSQRKETQTNPLLILNEAIEQQGNQSSRTHPRKKEDKSQQKKRKGEENSLGQLSEPRESINLSKRRKEIPNHQYEEMFILAPDNTSSGELMNHYCIHCVFFHF